MFKLEISDVQLEASFTCPFCETTYDWPFEGRIITLEGGAQHPFPDARHVIMSHHFGDENLKKFGFLKCPRWGLWTDTTWEAVNVDQGVQIGTGTVTVTEGYPSVTAAPAN